MVNRVLVAEDSPTQAAVLRGLLQDGGFDVTVATDGVEALAMFGAEQFDMVLSDVVMPRLDGYGLCRAVKDADPALPVVLLTSMSDPLDVVNALAAGADNFLRKPYEPGDLVRRVQNMLFNRQLRQSGRTQMGLELFFLGRRFMITSDREQVLDLLVSTFEEVVSLNTKLRDWEQQLACANDGLHSQLAVTELERERLQAVLDALPQGLAVLDEAGRIVQVNGNLVELLEADATSLVGTMAWDAPSFVTHDGRSIGAEVVEEVIRSGQPATVGTGFDMFLGRADGSRVPVVAKSAPVRNHDGDTVGSVVVMEDIGELLAHDPQTGLAGHGILIERVRTAFALSHAASKTAVLVVTIDRFPQIREALPRDASDAVLAEVVGRLREALKADCVQQRSPTASCAYLGNGELAVIAPGLAGEADAVSIGEVLADRLAGFVVIDDVDVNVTATVGVGICSADTHPTELVAAVAASSRLASARGGAKVVTSDPAMHAGAVEQLQREAELRRAIHEGQLVVHYQPQVELRSGRPVAMEALVRWEHPHDGLVGAGRVIPLAIQAGLIAPVGWWVLEQACRQAQHWRQHLPDAQDLVISVNIAAEQLAEDDVVDHVERILSSTGLQPDALVLELTESSMMDHSGPIGARLQGMKSLGVQFAVDDFGTGYSSLLQLRELPIDILKVDQRFVQGMIEQAADAAIVRGTVNLGHALGLELIAEGVETAEQLAELDTLGCDLGQGFHWSPALPADELPRWWATASRATQDGLGFTAPRRSHAAQRWPDEPGRHDGPPSVSTQEHSVSRR